MAEESDASEVKHWADKVALDVKERIEKNPQLKKVYSEQGILIYDEKTPSGVIHIGSGRGWIIHDVIAKSLRELGLKAKFVLSSDDMDPYDKPNKDLDNSWDKYLGMPFCDMPSPVKGYESFGAYYFAQVTDKFPDFGIECELEKTSDLYKKGHFNPAIKIILDNYEKVQQIYTDLYGETVASTRIPFNVKCPKCGKIATTLATSWDKKKELLTFGCKEDFVPWAKGCGYSGQISPYNGNGKFPWKVEWPAKWITKKVVVEYAGKDHFTKGGSRTFGCKLATEILNYPSPYPSDKYDTGKGYEFFTIGGAKMSTSKGRGVSFRESTEFAPAKVLRFLLVKTRPTAVLDFDPYKSNDMILLFERFDKCERVYYGETEGLTESEVMNQRRIYELSHIGKIPSKCPLQVGLGYASVVIQTTLGDVNKSIEIIKKTGHIPDNAIPEELKPIAERLNFAKKWVSDYAGDDYKFQLIENPKSKFDDKLRPIVSELIESLRGKDHTESSLFEEFYTLCKKHDVKNTEFFKAAYKILIDKERGPKLAPFVITIGKEKVADIFEKAI